MSVDLIGENNQVILELPFEYMYFVNILYENHLQSSRTVFKMHSMSTVCQSHLGPTTFAEALHSDYMKNPEQTHSEAKRSRSSSPLIISRDSFSHWTRDQSQIRFAEHSVFMRILPYIFN